MVISFRTRLFVVASLIVASVLAVVMALGWSTQWRYEVERLDERLCQEARRLALQPFRAIACLSRPSARSVKKQ